MSGIRAEILGINPATLALCPPGPAHFYGKPFQFSIHGVHRRLGKGLNIQGGHNAYGTHVRAAGGQCLAKFLVCKQINMGIQ